jgi:hypothetical protein
MFRAFRLIVEESVEARIVGMNGRKTEEFKEFTVEEIRRILTCRVHTCLNGRRMSTLVFLLLIVDTVVFTTLVYLHL